MISPKILAKLARARDDVGSIVRTERAVEVRTDDRGRVVDRSEWTYAPNSEVHERSTLALDKAGLMLVVGPAFRVDAVGGSRITVVAPWAVYDRDDWSVEPMSGESSLPIDASSIGVTAAAAGTIGMIRRHLALLLLDIQTPPADESQRALDTVRPSPRRLVAPAAPELAPRPIDVGPPAPRICDDAEPPWMAEPEPSPSVTVAEAKAIAVEAVVALNSARRAAGEPTTTTGEEVEAAGLRLSPNLGAAEWMQVADRLTAALASRQVRGA